MSTRRVCTTRCVLYRDLSSLRTVHEVGNNESFACAQRFQLESKGQRRLRFVSGRDAYSAIRVAYSGRHDARLQAHHLQGKLNAREHPSSVVQLFEPVSSRPRRRGDTRCGHRHAKQRCHDMTVHLARVYHLHEEFHRLHFVVISFPSARITVRYCTSRGVQ